MFEHLHRRILYGRQIRISAVRLIEMHGIGATAVARLAARDGELSEIERNYWAAVARRTARLATLVSAPGEAPEAPARPLAGQGGVLASPAFRAPAACETVPG